MNENDVKEAIVEMAESAYKIKAINRSDYNKILQGVGRSVKPEISAEKFICIRKKYNLSQVDLGEMLGCSTSSITKWERGISPIKGPLAVLMNTIDRHGIDFVAH